MHIKSILLKWKYGIIVQLGIMTTYIDPYMTVMMMVTEMYVSVTVVHHSLQNMMMMMTVGVIKKNVAVTMI